MSRTSQMQMIEDRNYYNDPRVRARDHDDGLIRDADEMTLTFVYDDDGETINLVFPGTFEVCDLCDGKGKHVNPSIDASGIGEDDPFWEDDRDEENDGESRYMRGDYDVNCYQCHGKRVMLVIDREAADETSLRRYDEDQQNRRDYERECRAERAMGC